MYYLKTSLRVCRTLLSGTVKLLVQNNRDQCNHNLKTPGPGVLQFELSGVLNSCG